MKDKNEDQILPMVKWSIANHIPLRFIEFMPLDGDALWSNKDVVSEAEILKALQPHYSVQVIEQQHEPARQYLLNNSYALGIISTITHSFCHQCDRIRLTAQGELYNCLFSPQGLNIKPQLQTLVNKQRTPEYDMYIQNLKIWSILIFGIKLKAFMPYNINKPVKSVCICLGINAAIYPN